MLLALYFRRECHRVDLKAVVKKDVFALPGIEISVARRMVRPFSNFTCCVTPGI
jgi:hypothetical protein